MLRGEKRKMEISEGRKGVAGFGCSLDDDLAGREGALDFGL